jgi:hypothetical protein
VSSSHLNVRVVVQLLEKFTGDGIHSVDQLVNWGLPRAFVAPLAKRHIEASAACRLEAADGRPQQHIRGVSDLDLLNAIGRSVRISPGALPETMNGKTLAGAYRRLIRATIEQARQLEGQKGRSHAL